MSLSPFDSFQSRFVTYLLNFPRISVLLTINNSVARMLNVDVTHQFYLACYVVPFST